MEVGTHLDFWCEMENEQCGMNDAPKLEAASCWKHVRNKFKVSKLMIRRTEEQTGNEKETLVGDAMTEAYQYLIGNGCIDPWRELSERLETGTSEVRDENISYLPALQRRNQKTKEVMQIEGAVEEMYDGPGIGLKTRPGFYVFPNALSDELVVTLAHRCRHIYCKPPHVTNVTSHLHRPAQKRPKLSWASLGYNFDWTLRKYFDEKQTPFPPELHHLTARFANRVERELQQNSNKSGSGDGMAIEPQKKQKLTPCSFKAETAIVNFYSAGMSMGAHIDDSEDDEAHPVVSLNLGLSCVFLIGTEKKEGSENDTPIPLLIRSRDVVILAGKSRLVYHGVASVLPHQIPSFSPSRHDLSWVNDFEMGLEGFVGSTEEKERKETESSMRIHAREADETREYLSRMRINLNVRQVLIDGHAKLLPDP